MTHSLNSLNSFALYYSAVFVGRAMMVIIIINYISDYFIFTIKHTTTTTLVEPLTYTLCIEPNTATADMLPTDRIKDSSNRPTLTKTA